MVERSDKMRLTGEGNGKPLQYSCLEKELTACSIILAWKIPRTEDPAEFQSMGSQESRTHLATKKQQQILILIKNVPNALQKQCSLAPTKLSSEGKHTETIPQKTSQSNHTALSNSVKLSHAMWGHTSQTGHGGEV